MTHSPLPYDIFNRPSSTRRLLKFTYRGPITKRASEYIKEKNLRIHICSNLHVYLRANHFWIDNIIFAYIIGTQDFLDNRFGRDLNFGRYDTLRQKRQFCPREKFFLSQIKELDSKRHTGKHLLGSIKRSTSTPVSKPLEDGVGYNRSAKFVSNVARIMSRLAGDTHCINSAYKNSCSKALCRSVKEIRRANILTKVNLSWNNSGKIGLIL